MQKKNFKNFGYPMYFEVTVAEDRRPLRRKTSSNHRYTRLYLHTNAKHQNPRPGPLILRNRESLKTAVTRDVCRMGLSFQLIFNPLAPLRV